MRKLPLLVLFAAGATLTAPLAVRAQDQVTIPKSRLEELEKKEAELEKLKGELNRAPREAARAGSVASQPGTIAVPALPAPYVPPAMDSLPPLREDETVQALDLAGHYAQSSSAADKRYLKRSFALEGTVERFEKRAFGRYYSIVLDTGASKVKVVCEVYPPQRFSAAFPANRGKEIYGASGESRILIAKAGNKVLVRGECKGLDQDEVVLKGCELKKVGDAAK
jgi:hypothetical protein